MTWQSFEVASLAGTVLILRPEVDCLHAAGVISFRSRRLRVDTELAHQGFLRQRRKERERELGLEVENFILQGL